MKSNNKASENGRKPKAGHPLNSKTQLDSPKQEELLFPPSKPETKAQ